MNGSNKEESCDDDDVLFSQVISTDMNMNSYNKKKKRERKRRGRGIIHTGECNISKYEKDSWKSQGRESLKGERLKQGNRDLVVVV